MDDDELDIPKGSLLKQLTDEDLEVHSVEALKNRINVLKMEIERTEAEIKNKKNAYADADSFFN
ncbi:DUF1192 domain-containing protein [Emcibacteraceae bacterium]|nr:DUF1192 domain-containing protein [Emcibacteraceae bacterium]